MTDTNGAGTPQERIAELEQKLADAIAERNTMARAYLELEAELDPLWQGTEEEVLARLRANSCSLEQVLAVVHDLAEAEIKRREAA